jgi:apolipoprotein N-acyltransferase
LIPAFFKPLRARLILALFLGGLMVFGYGPFYQYLIPVLLLAVLFRLWGHAPSRASAGWLGFAFGLGMFGTGVSWVYVSIHDFGGMPLPLAALATLLFCMFLALFTAAAGYVQARFKTVPVLRYVVVMPALWVVVEWIRDWVMTGFPWLSVGYSQIPDGPLAGYGPVFGVFGISLAVSVSAGLIAYLYDHRRSLLSQATPAIWTVALILLWAVGTGLKQVVWTEPIGQPVTVSLLQGNVPQDMKWQQSKVVSTLISYRDMVEQSKGQLVILPETALPLFFDNVPAEYINELTELATRRHADLLIGVPERGANPDNYYNSVVSLGESGRQWYRKYHLVPFGEYIPMKPFFGWIVQVLHIPLSDFSRGDPFPLPLRLGSQKVAVNICYEDVFGEEIIHQLPQATVLVNVSNDAWFGRSVAPEQHLQISQARALETGRYMLRATNTGVTAIVDQHGQVVKRAPEFQKVALEGSVQGYAGTTPYVRFGNIPVIVILASMLGAVLKISRRRKH